MEADRPAPARPARPASGPWMWIAARAMCYLLLTGTLGACASAPPSPGPGPPIAITWPSPPDPPRVRYVGTLVGEVDVRGSVNRSLWSRIWRGLLGESTPQVFAKPVDVEVDAQGRIYVADTALACVHVLDRAKGRYQRLRDVIGHRSLVSPVGVAVGPDGRVFVADSELGLIAVYSPEGKAIASWGERSLKRPSDPALGPDGSVYVADVGAHQIVQFAPDGTERRRFGKRGTGPGEFNYPSHLAVDPGGGLWVVDTLNSRVQHLTARVTSCPRSARWATGPGTSDVPRGSLSVPAASSG